MMLRAAIALIVLAAPALAQHGGTHGGSFGSRGFAEHVGISSHPGLSRPSSFVRPGQPIRESVSVRAGLQSNATQIYSGLRLPYNGKRFTAGRPSFSLRAGSARAWDQARDPFRVRRRSFETWYARTYPTWLGYGHPYVIDPGFYDWGDSDNSASEQGGAPAVYPAPYLDGGNDAPSEPLATARLASPLLSPERPLTLIFKSGRAPVKVENYMVTAKVLTDLDSQHYEQISLSQIDLDATQRANSAAGVELQIPNASHD